MMLLRFAFLGLCAIGVAACAYATARLIGWVPPGKLPLYPAWAAIHFASATAFCVIAPLQLWPRMRERWPKAHRRLGRAGVAIGSMMAATGLAVVYAAPNRPVSELIFMTAFFAAYAAMLAMGFRAALARKFVAHRAWMMRMTATALTPVTQRVIFPALAASIGIDGAATFWQIFVSAAWIAWAVNMSLTEAWLGRRVRAARDADERRAPQALTS